LLTYAIPDLHGRFDLLLKSYAVILERAAEAPGTIVHLGDYVDRGPQSREVVEYLMNPATVPVGWERSCLRGNHEDIMIASAGNIDLCERWWVPNGGDQALLSYGAHAGEDLEAALSRVPQQHIDWMRGLPRMHIDEHRIFVHAGVDAHVPLDEQDDERLGWMRYPRGAEEGHGDRHVVHGHTPHIEGPILYRGRTNLDTKAWLTGRLVIGIFDSERAGGAVDFLEIIGEPLP